MPFATTTTNTVLFLSIFILAFFPSLFASLLRVPLLPFTYTSSKAPATTTPSVPTCCCSTSNPTQPAPGVLGGQDNKMAWFQKQFTLPSKSRGSYLVTDTVTKELPEIKDYKVGLLNLFVQHTSCALTLNENWDTDVRYIGPLSYVPDFSSSLSLACFKPSCFLFFCFSLASLLSCYLLSLILRYNPARLQLHSPNSSRTKH